MIGAFIGGFIAGGLVTFILLVIIAICSLKSKERKLKEVVGAVKFGKNGCSPFIPYADPINIKDIYKGGAK